MSTMSEAIETTLAARDAATIRGLRETAARLVMERDAALAEIERLKAELAHATECMNGACSANAEYQTALEAIRGYVVMVQPVLKTRAEFHEAFKLLDGLSVSWPKCPRCGSRLGDHHHTTCRLSGQVLPSEIPGYVESVAADVLAGRNRR